MFEMYNFSVDMEATGKRIRAMRKERGITADNLAEYMGFTTAQPIYKWQRGLCLPEIPNLIALSRLFGVRVEEIVVIKEAAGEKPAAFDVNKLNYLFFNQPCQYDYPFLFKISPIILSSSAFWVDLSI